MSYSKIESVSLTGLVRVVGLVKLTGFVKLTGLVKLTGIVALTSPSTAGVEVLVMGSPEETLMQCEYGLKNSGGRGGKLTPKGQEGRG